MEGYRLGRDDLYIRSTVSRGREHPSGCVWTGGGEGGSGWVGGSAEDASHHHLGERPRGPDPGHSKRTGKHKPLRKMEGAETSRTWWAWQATGRSPDFQAQQWRGMCDGFPPSKLRDS